MLCVRSVNVQLSKSNQQTCLPPSSVAFFVTYVRAIFTSEENRLEHCLRAGLHVDDDFSGGGRNPLACMTLGFTDMIDPSRFPCPRQTRFRKCGGKSGEWGRCYTSQSVTLRFFLCSSPPSVRVLTVPLISKPKFTHKLNFSLSSNMVDD